MDRILFLSCCSRHILRHIVVTLIHGDHPIPINVRLTFQPVQQKMCEYPMSKIILIWAHLVRVLGSFCLSRKDLLSGLGFINGSN